ncbi:Transcription regulator [Fimbriimonas ginsengisoli Gsoil 348]|uniref:Transcription regulator n=1 Tax=Fimbriimonas ginsengisoli Gsoil 348 TaxID=661478 RepID=A0A068NU70_FIMGI|nr:Transcription regulator [Fimbriimonas ginsengisoli Gsoil 348]
MLNERSGGADEHVRPAIEAAMRSGGSDWFPVEVGEGESASEKICSLDRDSFDGLIVAGGDGTVMEAVNGLMRYRIDVPLAIVPTGTANFVARALDVPQDASEALAIAMAGSIRRIDIGQCGTRFFALGVGLGLAERFVTATEEGEKRRLGPWAYLLTLIREVRTPNAVFVLERPDGTKEQLEGVAMVVANAAGLGNGHAISREVLPDDGLLDVVILHRLSSIDACRLAIRALGGNLTRDRVVTHRQGREFTLHSRPKVPIQIDGDDVPQTLPLRVTIHPLSLSVFVRPKFT